MLAKADKPRLNQGLCRDYVASYNENPMYVSIWEKQRTNQPPRINMSIQNYWNSRLTTTLYLPKVLQLLSTIFTKSVHKIYTKKYSTKIN